MSRDKASLHGRRALGMSSAQVLRQQTNEFTPALAPAPDRGGDKIPGLWAASGSGIFLRLCVEALRRGLVPHQEVKREGGHLDVLDRSPCICRPSSIIYHECSAPFKFLVRIRNCVVKVLGRIVQTLGLDTP